MSDALEQGDLRDELFMRGVEVLARTTYGHGIALALVYLDQGTTLRKVSLHSHGVLSHIEASRVLIAEAQKHVAGARAGEIVRALQDGRALDFDDGQGDEED